MLLYALKKKKNKYLLDSKLSFFKKDKSLKLSFLYLFFLKKKISGVGQSFDFFFYNSLYYFFFKKINALLNARISSLVFIADDTSIAVSNITDLNFFLLKKNYIFMRLSR